MNSSTDDYEWSRIHTRNTTSGNSRGLWHTILCNYSNHCSVTREMTSVIEITKIRS